MGRSKTGFTFYEYDENLFLTERFIEVRHIWEVTEQKDEYGTNIHIKFGPPEAWQSSLWGHTTKKAALKFRIACIKANIERSCEKLNEADKKLKKMKD